MSTKTLQDAEREAKKVIAGWTAGAALTGWVPGSTIFLTAGDLAMIYQVARAFDVKEFDTEQVTLMIRQLIIGGGTYMAVSEVVGLVPIAGWAIKSASMAAKAHLVGYSVINYFRVRSKLPNHNPNSSGDKLTIDIPLEDN